jgi:hypothetical protein
VHPAVSTRNTTRGRRPPAGRWTRPPRVPVPLGTQPNARLRRQKRPRLTNRWSMTTRLGARQQRPEQFVAPLLAVPPGMGAQQDLVPSGQSVAHRCRLPVPVQATHANLSPPT